MRLRRLAALALLATLLAGAAARADDAVRPEDMPRTSRYASTNSYLRGGEAERLGLEAENGRLQGAEDNAVELGPEIDAQGNYTQVHFRLEVAEVQEEVYPGQFVTFWVYAPLGRTMSSPARLPSPTLRVQEGDRVKVTLYNTHYLPHTIHFHGLPQSWDMDGMPGMPHPEVMPGESFTYQFTAKTAGTFWYHCHVQEDVHVPMGLAGMFIVEPRRPNNHFARMTPGAGRIDIPAKGTAEAYQGEYSLVYMDVDDRLHRIPAMTHDVREIERRMHRDYDTSQRRPNIFLLNGRSFPYTLRDSPILVKPDQQVKLRILNIGGHTVHFHPHGHRPVLTALDGSTLNDAQQIRRDVFDVGPGQRIDLAMSTKGDGVEASGPGLWMVHDHSIGASTNRGIGPGGATTEIRYEGFGGGQTMASHASHALYFDPAYYRGERPVFGPQTEDAAPLAPRSDLAYPTRVVLPEPPRLDLIEVERHRTIATACATKAKAVRHIRLKAGRAYAAPGEAYGFSPRQLTVGRCEEIELLLENEDSVRHDFMIAGLSPMFSLNFVGPGVQSARFISPDADVTLSFHCHVAAHDKVGMTGEIVVGRGGKPELQVNIIQAQAQATGSVEGVGVVIATIPRSNRLIIDHEEIRGFMAAMEMSYPVVDPGLLDGVEAGDRIGFTIDRATNRITAVKTLRKAN